MITIPKVELERIVANLKEFLASLEKLTSFYETDPGAPLPCLNLSNDER